MWLEQTFGGQTRGNPSPFSKGDNMVICRFNIMGDYWETVDNTGLIVGIGDTPRESIENAEFWGLDCSNVEILDKF